MTTKKTSKKLIAKIFVDRFVPGSEIPADHYEKEVLEKMIETGQVEAVEQ